MSRNQIIGYFRRQGYLVLNNPESLVIYCSNRDVTESELLPLPSTIEYDYLYTMPARHESAYATVKIMFYGERLYTY